MSSRVFFLFQDPIQISTLYFTGLPLQHVKFSFFPSVTFNTFDDLLVQYYVEHHSVQFGLVWYFHINRLIICLLGQNIIKVMLCSFQGIISEASTWFQCHIAAEIYLDHLVKVVSSINNLVSTIFEPIKLSIPKFTPSIYCIFKSTILSYTQLCYMWLHILPIRIC